MRSIGSYTAISINIHEKSITRSHAYEQDLSEEDEDKKKQKLTRSTHFVEKSTDNKSAARNKNIIKSFMALKNLCAQNVIFEFLTDEK